MCEEMFRGEMDVTEKPEGEKFLLKKLRGHLHHIHERDLEALQKVEGVLQEMEKFCRT